MFPKCYLDARNMYTQWIFSKYWVPAGIGLNVPNPWVDKAILTLSDHSNIKIL